MAADDHDDAIIKGFLTSSDGERVADYVRRGRKHATLLRQHLESNWCLALKVHVDDLRDTEKRLACRDLEAEFALREEQPPYAMAEDDLRKMREAVPAAIEKIRKEDPDRYEQIERQLEEDIGAFIEASGRRSN